MRNTLFIGHANPQDNDFAVWLCSKLELEGYIAWSDLTSLYGGESDFWEDIQNTIKDETIKYLLVFSRNSFKKGGVKDEFEFARSIEQQFKLKDFIIPLKIDNVPYTERIGINRRNVISFNPWAPGLRQLLIKLAKDQVPKKDKNAPAISDWIVDLHLHKKSGLITEEELHYSNWWPINALPENIYLFQYSHEFLAKAIIEEDADYPVVKHGNYLVSFERKIKNISQKNNHTEINPISVQQVPVKQILSGAVTDEFPSLTESENFLKRLIKKAFKNLMYKNGLLKKDLSNDQCFFYTNDTLPKNWTTARYPNRKRRQTIVGKYRGSFWHFAVSANVRLKPFVCYSLKSHILFSDDGRKIWEDDGKLHSARRSKGKRWFNEEWRDHLIAFIGSLSKQGDRVAMKLEEDFILKMPLVTKEFYSEVGYDEPETKKRLNTLYETDESLHQFEEWDLAPEDEQPEPKDTEND